MNLGQRRRIALVALALTLALRATILSAQTESGITPVGIAHGSPEGSYPLSDIDTINMFSGGLSVHVPLIKVGGRGTAGVSANLIIERHWGLETSESPGFPTFFYLRVD